MRATDLARIGAIWLWALVGAAGPTAGCGWSTNNCFPDEYVPTGPEVESVEECPPFPGSCPVDCDISSWTCTEDGLRCEDCARVQEWLDRNESERPCLRLDTAAWDARGFTFECGPTRH